MKMSTGISSSMTIARLKEKDVVKDRQHLAPPVILFRLASDHHNEFAGRDLGDASQDGRFQIVATVGKDLCLERLALGRPDCAHLDDAAAAENAARTSLQERLPNGGR